LKRLLVLPLATAACALTACGSSSPGAAAPLAPGAAEGFAQAHAMGALSDAQGLTTQMQASVSESGAYPAQGGLWSTTSGQYTYTPPGGSPISFEQRASSDATGTATVLAYGSSASGITVCVGWGDAWGMFSSATGQSKQGNKGSTPCV
jgi:hypothetical protein